MTVATDYSAVLAAAGALDTGSSASALYADFLSGLAGLRAAEGTLWRSICAAYHGATGQVPNPPALSVADIIARRADGRTPASTDTAAALVASVWGGYRGVTA